MNIRKNDIVTNNVEVTQYNTVIPIGSQFRVWKAKRDGTLYATQINDKGYNPTTMLNSSQVTKIETPKTNVKVGDIFVCSWGYDQTNIDYYVVRNVKNKTVIISPVGQDRNYTGNMQGECVPNITKISDRTITKRIQGYGDKVCLKMTSYSCAYPWNGRANNFTEWA